LNFHEFSWGRFTLPGPEYQRNIAASEGRRSLRAAVLATALGAVVLLTGCYDFNPNLGAAPTQSSAIFSISPSARAAGCSGFTLDIQGTGFVNGAIVEWNGSTRATNFESPTELLATITDSDLATQGQATVGVSIPGQMQGNDLSNLVPFTITAPIPPDTCPIPASFPPSIIALSQYSGAVGTSIQIAGKYFGGVQGTSTVTFNGILATPTSWSGTRIVVPVPTGATAGTIVVTVSGVASTPLSPGAASFTVVGAQGTTSAIAVTGLASATTTHSLSITAGPRYVAFVASSADPSTATVTGMDKIYLRDTCQGAPAGCTPATVLVSVGFDGTDPNGASRSPSISASGRFVAFASDANNLIKGDANGVADIFLRDTCIGAPAGCVPATTRVSSGPDGIEANGASASPSISPDGRFVAFDSAATNLLSDGSVYSPPGASTEAFLHDTCFGAASSCTPSTTRLSVTATPSP
jgi:trimeric autotransporter adhesin